MTHTANLNKVMPCHITDRLYEHTNGWTNSWKLPTEEQLSELPIKAILISRISPLYKELVNHVYFQAESLEDGHVGYYKTFPVFIPSLSFKSGAPLRMVTMLTRHGNFLMEKFQ